MLIKFCSFRALWCTGFNGINRILFSFGSFTCTSSADKSNKVSGSFSVSTRPFIRLKYHRCQKYNIFCARTGYGDEKRQEGGGGKDIQRKISITPSCRPAALRYATREDKRLTTSLDWWLIFREHKTDWVGGSCKTDVENKQVISHDTSDSCAKNRATLRSS